MSLASIRKSLPKLSTGQWLLFAVAAFTVIGGSVGWYFNGFTGAYRTGGMAFAFAIAALIFMILAAYVLRAKDDPVFDDEPFPIAFILFVAGCVVTGFGLTVCCEVTETGNVSVRLSPNGTYSVLSRGEDRLSFSAPWYPQETIRYRPVGFNAKMRQAAADSGELFEVRIWMEATPDQELLYERLSVGTDPEELASYQAVSTVSQVVVDHILIQRETLEGKPADVLTREVSGIADQLLQQHALRPKFFRILSLEKVHSG